MTTLDWCARCRAIMLRAAETGEPYKVADLCPDCAAILAAAGEPGFDWLAPLPVLAQWMREHGPKGYSPLRRFVRQQRALEWDQVRRFNLAMADAARTLLNMLIEAPGLRALADLLGSVPMQLTIRGGGEKALIEIEPALQAAAIAIADPERPWSAFGWGPSVSVPDPRFPGNWWDDDEIPG